MPASETRAPRHRLACARPARLARLLVVLVVGDETRLDAVAVQQDPRPAGVLAGHHVGFAQTEAHAASRLRGSRSVSGRPPGARSCDQVERQQRRPQHSRLGAECAGMMPPITHRRQRPLGHDRAAGSISRSPAASAPPPSNTSSGLNTFHTRPARSRAAADLGQHLARDGSPWCASSVTIPPVISRPPGGPPAHSESDWPGSVEFRHDRCEIPRPAPPLRLVPGTRPGIPARDRSPPCDRSPSRSLAPPVDLAVEHQPAATPVPTPTSTACETSRAAPNGTSAEQSRVHVVVHHHGQAPGARIHVAEAHILQWQWSTTRKTPGLPLTSAESRKPTAVTSERPRAPPPRPLRRCRASRLDRIRARSVAPGDAPPALVHDAAEKLRPPASIPITTPWRMAGKYTEGG